MAVATKALITNSPGSTRAGDHAEAEIHRRLNTADGPGHTGKAAGQQVDQHHGDDGVIAHTANKGLDTAVQRAAGQQQRQGNGRQYRDRGGDLVEGHLHAPGLKPEAAADKKGQEQQ
ncbi:hypothetical protein [Microbulbifer taiwanensis]|uniref:hypothetical protein n=1 Tax=Microbulbifer taiwanensis TaxID=986746 RepID=UPI0036070455